MHLWKQGRFPHGHEFYHYPSPIALRMWFYLRSLGRTHAPASFRHEHRSETGFLIHFFKRGKLWHRIHERDHVAGAGEVCLFETKDVSYGAEKGTRPDFYWAWFNHRDMPFLFRELRADQDPIFRLPDTKRMESLFRELISFARKPPPACEARTSAILTSMLAELQASRFPDSHTPSVAGETKPLSDATRRAIHYISRTYAHPITVKRLASSAAHQSLFHFSRQFHREVGLSPIAYLNQYRIEHAKRLLETTTHSMEEIARCVGYPNQNYFSRRFTRIAGMSPRQYRTEHQRKR